MFYKHAGPDRDMHISDLLLTLCSMSLSGYFGYVIGEGMFPLNWVLCAVGAAAAYGVSMWFKRAAFNRSMGNTMRAKRCLFAGILCLGANVLFDFSSAAALRDQVSTLIGNENVKATNREQNLKLVDDEIAGIKRQTAWSKPHKSAEAYRAEIADLESKADIMRRSKDCSDQTRPDTKAHCQLLAEAKGNLADLNQKVLLDARLKELDAKRIKAVADAEGNQHKSNPAVAVIRMVGAVALRKERLNESEAFWVGLSIMLLMTGLINASLYSLATEIGEMRAAEFLAANGGMAPVTFTAPRLPGPAEAKEPIPLKAHDTNLVVINGEAQKDSTQTDQLIQMAMAAMDRYAKSNPFSKQEGRA